MIGVFALTRSAFQEDAPSPEGSLITPKEEEAGAQRPSPPPAVGRRRRRGRTRERQRGACGAASDSSAAARPRALMFAVVRRRLVPILASLAGAALIALLLYGVSTQSANRTLDEQVARHNYPVAPDATRALPVLGASTSRIAGFAAWQGRGAELLGVVVRTVPDRGAAARARAGRRSNGTARRCWVSPTRTTRPTPKASCAATTSPILSFATPPANSRASYGTHQVPESFIINRQGRIVAISRGEIEQGFVNQALAALARTRVVQRGGLGRARHPPDGRRAARGTADRGRARSQPRAGSCRCRAARLAAGDRAPGHVRDVQSRARWSRGPAGQHRARIHPEPDQPRARTKPKSSARWSPSTARPCWGCRAPTASTWPHISCRALVVLGLRDDGRCC